MVAAIAVADVYLARGETLARATRHGAADRLQKHKHTIFFLRERDFTQV